ncbi:serine/threonine-protein kinase [Mycobacterium sp. TY814]|uniref:serine/threonine-protein kinase n=1 Tax=unclassified Mycobacterium TaxID=2642494 RepID=UPI0027416B95|nr:serine/threonine-protein kinase [Mycobacterium sp. TY814]MDP7726272.1 serine/threonine-protein kinase [Mycobacterium sp. TY814]
MDTTHPLTLKSGELFAGFRIIRVLGAGGMGTVYLAEHPRLPRENALKVLPAQWSADPVYRARFEREAELAADLSHPNIVQVHDRGEQGGQFWLSMDYVAGTDASRLLREKFSGGMPLDEVVPIINAVASALDYAHHRGLLHRDVKPANILLDGEQPRGIFLADFGIARRIDDGVGLTATNMTVGTVNYSAPEQLRGDPIDGRADQYALACTAFHLLTGAPPFEDSKSAVVISRHVGAPPPSIGAVRPELAGLDWVFATAMAKDPTRRFGRCQEFAEQLARYAAPGFAYAEEIPGGPVLQYPTYPSMSATLPALPRVTPSRGKRTRVVAAALACIALLIAGGIVAGEKLISHYRSSTAAKTPAAESPTTTTPAPNTGPFTGSYQVEYGVVTGVDGQAAPKPMTPTTETWAVRSVCGSAGCVATASRQGGETMYAPEIVLDQVNGTWIAVTIGSTTCGNVEGEEWETFTLQPRPDGSLAGEATQTMAKGCANKRSVTFTRTGDANINSLPDPAALPPRVTSPAAALHGHYHQLSVQPNGFKDQGDYMVRTDCLRTGARCVSLFHTAPATAMVLQYADGTWNYDREFDATCGRGGPTHVRIVVPYALPQPLQDPITTLSGNGHEELTGNCPSTDVQVTFTRTGD